jgi:hypothetical protein
MQTFNARPARVRRASFVTTVAAVWTAAMLIATSIVHAQTTTPSFTGTWDTNAGTLELTQTGNRVTGKITEAANPRTVGTVTGVVSNNRLSGDWTIGSKRGRFSNVALDARGDTFTGADSIYKTLCGAKKGKPLPANCGFSGQWTIELNGAGTGTATLSQTGNSVSGSYSTKLTSGRLIGSVVYQNGLPVLSGKWSASRTGGLAKSYLASLDARQFQGNFDGKLAFCGWRGGETKPRTCLKS